MIKVIDFVLCLAEYFIFSSNVIQGHMMYNSDLIKSRQEYNTIIIIIIKPQCTAHLTVIALKVIVFVHGYHPENLLTALQHKSNMVKTAV